MTCGHTKYEGKEPCGCDTQLFCKECGCGEDHHLAIQRVRELHKTDEPYWGATDARSVTADKLITPCYNCGQEYPCDTIKALDGEQSEYPKGPIPRPEEE